MCKEAKLGFDQYVIRHRYLPPEEDFGITMSNRAGMMSNAEYEIKPLEKSLKVPCYYPSYTFFRLQWRCFDVPTRLGKTKNFR